MERDGTEETGLFALKHKPGKKESQAVLAAVELNGVRWTSRCKRAAVPCVSCFHLERTDRSTLPLSGCSGRGQRDVVFPRKAWAWRCLGARSDSDPSFCFLSLFPPGALITLDPAPEPECFLTPSPPTPALLPLFIASSTVVSW